MVHKCLGKIGDQINENEEDSAGCVLQYVFMQDTAAGRNIGSQLPRACHIDPLNPEMAPVALQIRGVNSRDDTAIRHWSPSQEGRQIILNRFLPPPIPTSTRVNKE